MLRWNHSKSSSSNHLVGFGKAEWTGCSSVAAPSSGQDVHELLFHELKYFSLQYTSINILGEKDTLVDYILGVQTIYQHFWAFKWKLPHHWHWSIIACQLSIFEWLQTSVNRDWLCLTKPVPVLPMRISIKPHFSSVGLKMTEKVTFITFPMQGSSHRVKIISFYLQYQYHYTAHTNTI